MISLLFTSLIANLFGGSITDRVLANVVDKVVQIRVTSPSGDTSDEVSTDSDDDEDTDADAEVIPPVPPVSGPHGGVRAPLLPNAPKTFHFEFKDSGRELPRFTEKAKGVPTVELLHRIAQTAGWSVTIVGSPKEPVDIDVKDADPREALKSVLKQSGALGVLKNTKLVVVATSDSAGAGTLIERTDSRKTLVMPGQPGHTTSRRHHSGNDMVKVMQGDLTVPPGQVVLGDVVCVGGSIELSPGSVVQGDAVAVGGSVTLNEGALVMGKAVAVLGTVDVARGAQVMGEHVHVGVGKLFGSSSSSRKHGWLTSLGPFGLFPTIGLFALIHVLGLLMLRMWPDRARNVGFAMFENPVRSFAVGFLCWLLLLPLIVLLAISIVGIPLIPLLPVILFLSIVMGLSSFAMRIGESLPAGPGQRFVPPAAMGLGMAVLLLAALVPWLGVSLLALLQFFALGAAVSSRFGRALPPHTP